MFNQDFDLKLFNAHAARCGLVCDDESLTVQSQAEEANINTIVRRFGLTGQVPSGVRPAMFGDFTGVSDFRSAIDAVRAAEASFGAMPADVRARFRNDPQEFVAFCSDVDNLAEMRKMGLAVPEVVEANPKKGDSNG